MEIIEHHHIKKYSLTHTTPLMCMPIQQELGFDSLTPAGQRILEGNHTQAPDTEQLKRKTTKLIPTGMSTQEFITGWKKAKEQTMAM
jgi:hypothetical protein